MNADMKWLDNPEVFKVNQLAPHSDHSYYLDYSDMKKEKIVDATTIGYKKIIDLQGVETDAIEIRIEDSRVAPVISFVGVY